MTLPQRESADVRAREDAARPGPAYRIAAEKITQAAGLRLSAETTRPAMTCFHEYVVESARSLRSRSVGGVRPPTAWPLSEEADT